MNITRRNFIGGLGLAALVPDGYGQLPNDLELRLGTPSAASPNYWCTWCSQKAVKRATGGKERDITAACAFADGRWTLPGDTIAKVGGELTTDKSLPAALVRFFP